LSVVTTLKKDPLSSLKLLQDMAEKGIENSSDLESAYDKFKTNVQNWKQELSFVANKVQQMLGLSGIELIIYASGSLIIFIMITFFIFWGFSAIQKTSLGIGILQSVIIALFGLVSKLVSDAKTKKASLGDPTLRKDLGNKIVEVGKSIIKTYKTGDA